MNIENRYRLSLIVAVYNLSGYIEACLYSILPQLNGQVELLVINDGSVDHSADIVSDLIKDYPDAKLYSKTNGGLGSARNYGLERAQGEYIWFIDGDDEIDSNAIEVLVGAIESGSFDQVVFYAKHLRLNETAYRIQDKLLSGEFDSVEELHKTLGSIPVAVWSSIFKREFLISNALFFHPNMYFEDSEFMLRFYNKVTLIKLIPAALYCYKARPGSIMKSSVNQKKLNDLLYVIESYKKLQPAKISKPFLELQLYWQVKDLLALLSGSDGEGIRQRLYTIVPKFKIFFDDPIGIIRDKILYNISKEAFEKYS